MAKMKKANVKITERKYSWKNICLDFKKHKFVYLFLVPVLLYYTVFQYCPMAGMIIAFKDYKPIRGIWGSEWVGLEHFITFFGSYYFWDILRNTISLSVCVLVFGFPAPIILALLVNEVRSAKFKKVVQTITYMPHFISIVVMAGIVVDMTSTNGVLSVMLGWFGINLGNLMYIEELFLPIYTASNIWQNLGWSSIIYISALAAVPMELYEAANVDGASRMSKIWHVSLPGIMPTIITLLIMRLGNIMTVGWEQVVLLSNPIIIDKAQVISSFVYTAGMEEGNYGYAAAVGLFNSVINFALLMIANTMSKKLNDTSLW